MRMAWQMWESGIAPDVCDRLMEEGMKGPPLRGLTFGDTVEGNEPNGHRVSKIRWCNHAPWVLELMNGYIEQANIKSCQTIIPISSHNS